jgi:hypothetical protein
MLYSADKIANRDVRGFGRERASSRGRFATPADFPRHECRMSVLCRPVPNLNVTIRIFCIAVGRTV